MTKQVSQGNRLIAGLFGGIGYGDTLNTRKIDRNIERLNQHEWFKKIYEDEKYHRLFFVNRKVRSYLQSTIRVNKMVRNIGTQERLVGFLNKQLTS